MQICFSSLDIFGLAPSFRKICEEQSIEVVDWSALGLIKALRAGQQNLDTEIFQFPWGSNLPEKTKLMTQMQTPLRKLAKPEDIAETASFLISRNSSHITGETIRVCGGLVML